MRPVRQTSHPANVPPARQTSWKVIRLLVEGGWLDAARLPELERMAGFRNVLVHGYTAVDPAIVRDVLEHHLEDLEGFRTEILARLHATGA